MEGVQRVVSVVTGVKGEQSCGRRIRSRTVGRRDGKGVKEWGGG